MKKTLRVVLVILCICLIGVSVFIFYKDLTTIDPLYEEALNDIEVNDSDKSPVFVDNSTIVRMSPDIDIAAERIKHNNNDIIGRLEIPDLFNIIVVNGLDNKYYLNRDIDKKVSVKGNEFIDYRIKPDAKQLNVYGHNSRDPNIKVPFLRLEKFIDEDFFNNNQYIIWQYEGGKRVYKITAWKEILKDNNEHMKVSDVGEHFLSHMVKLLDNTTYKREVPYDVNSNIIVLQTCSHHLDNAFYLLIGIEVSYRGA